MTDDSVPPDFNNPDYLKSSQYADSANLGARIRLHQLYSTSPVDLHRWLFDHMLADFGEQARILELGSGRGDIWAKNAERIPAGWDVTLTDFSPGMLDDARAHIGPAADRLRFEQADADAIPYDAHTFDAVIANYMLYHVPDERRTIAAIRRVLKDDGCLHAATNGERHMAELDEAIEAVLPAEMVAAWRSRYMQKLRFRLETGADLLKSDFAHVQRVDFDDALKVTEAQPLVDYVLSMRGISAAVTPELVEAFRQQIAAYIETDGVFHITKSTGLFVARGYAQVSQ